MTSLFKEKIREKIADQALQAALDGNAEKRVKGRINAFTSLPDWRERRQKAHAIRAEVIDHLDDYLAQFIGNVQKTASPSTAPKTLLKPSDLCWKLLKTQKIRGNLRNIVPDLGYLWLVCFLPKPKVWCPRRLV